MWPVRVVMDRLVIRVIGAVQGVGFRPFIYKLATRLSLSGFVRNEGDSVRIEVEGEPEVLDRFRGELTARVHVGSRIAEMVIEEMPAKGISRFIIARSSDRAGDRNFAP